MLAATGHVSEIPPAFTEPLSAVAGGGVLAGLPMLLKEGLLERARAFLSLPKGYYGLNSILLLLAFLILARIRNPEALRHQAPQWHSDKDLLRSDKRNPCFGRLPEAGGLILGSVQISGGGSPEPFGPWLL